jgi:hypothetical protein
MSLSYQRPIQAAFRGRVVGQFDLHLGGMETGRFRAHIRKMKKRIGWKLCRSIGGTYEVAEVLEGGIIGREIFDFPSNEEAEKFINSDGAASSKKAHVRARKSAFWAKLLGNL